MTDPIVEVQSGLVRGVVVGHEEGFEYFAFRGIPYAEPPIGELRFKDPIPIKQWTEVIDCKDYGPACLQFDFFSKVASHEEDSLRLNVFTRSINEEDVNNPVMMVIHGGGFSFGSGSDFLYGPDYLIRKNLVLVTFNYRLGILGFLNLEDEVAPGNQGLKDQLMVLKWIRQNIRFFGGDPDNVTIFGASAGAVAAQYAALSPLTIGLFHKVICQGATLYNPWIDFSDGKANAIKLCSLLGRKLTDPEEIVTFLRSVGAKELEEAQERLRVTLGALPFGPAVDDKSSNPYMPINREVAADKGIHFPSLTGYTDREGILLLADGVSFTEGTKANFFKTADLDFGSVLKYNTTSIADRYNLNANQIKRLYYKNEVVSEKNLENYVDFASDVFFVEGIHRFAKLQAEKSSAATYLFQFSFDNPGAFSKVLVSSNIPGACHLDELPFLFKFQAFDQLGIEHFKKGTREYKMMEQMTEMWSNFARYGKPTMEISELVPVHWLPINDGTVLRYLNFDDDVTMQSTINVDQKLMSAKNINA